VHQLKWLHGLSFFEGGARYAQSLSYFYFDRATRSDLYGDRMSDELVAESGEQAIVSSFESAHAREFLDRMLASDVEIRLPDHPVMITDRMTMAHGLEARSPYMDHELAEFAARIPIEMKVRGRSLRYLQRKLASRYLPAKVMAMPKQGFSSALPYLLGDEYRRLFTALVGDESWLVRDGWMGARPMTRLVREHGAGVRDHGNRLWLLLNAEIWYRMRICGQDREDLRMELQRLTGAATSRVERIAHA
jgi:asparagine synthase (glutamine-hydrolysing)